MRFSGDEQRIGIGPRGLTRISRQKRCKYQSNFLGLVIRAPVCGGFFFFFKSIFFPFFSTVYFLALSFLRIGAHRLQLQPIKSCLSGCGGIDCAWRPLITVPTLGHFVFLQWWCVGSIIEPSRIQPDWTWGITPNQLLNRYGFIANATNTGRLSLTIQ